MLKENRPTQLPFSFRSKWHAAEVYIWIVLLIFGIGACLILPISGGYDEETHLMRAWQISGFQFLPNADKNGKMPFPAVYWEMSYRRQVLVTAVEPGLWQKYGQLAMDAHDYIYGSVDTRSVYSPPLLIPQAIVLRWLGRSERLPALPVYYLCRLVGLFSYLLLVWLGVRLIPFGKWIFAILATSPVMILQASTISADAISNGIAWLFIGGVLASAAQKDLHWKQWLQLVILIFVLFWGKLNIIPLVILPFLLLRPAQFKIKHGYILLITITVVLFLVEVVGWNSLAYSQLHTAPDGTSPIGQVKFILSHPITFVSILDKDIIIHGGKYLQNWIAIYGFNYWPVPAWTYYLYGFGVVCALFVKPESIDRRTRFILLFVFAITYLFTITSLYLTFNPVGSPSIDGVQGRYFGTVMPLLFLALAGIQFQKPLLIPNALPILFGVLSLTLYLVGMYLSYHVPCGSQYYQLGLCYQPNYKNWSPDALYSPPLNTSLTLAQEIVPTCNGMSQIRVWTNAVGSDPAGSTEFIVKDMQQNKVVVDTHSTNSALPQGDWFTVNFKPDWSSQGKFYLLTLRSEVSGPRFAYSLKPEYPAGKLFENDQALDQDIIFQTGCIAGLEKLRLPNSP